MPTKDQKIKEIKNLHEMSLLAKDSGNLKEYRRLRNILRVNACIWKIDYPREKCWVKPKNV